MLTAAVCSVLIATAAVAGPSCGRIDPGHFLDSACGPSDTVHTGTYRADTAVAARPTAE